MCFSTSMFIIVSTVRKKYWLRGSKCEAFNKIKLNLEIKILFKNSYEYNPQKDILSIMLGSIVHVTVKNKSVYSKRGKRY